MTDRDDLGVVRECELDCVFESEVLSGGAAGFELGSRAASTACSKLARIALFLGALLVAAVWGTLSRSTRDVPAPDDVAPPEASPEAAR